MRLHRVVILLVSFAWTAPSSRAARLVAPVIRAPSTGWTLPSALRAVVLNDMRRTLPAGVSLGRIASLPAQSPFWSEVAQAFVESNYSAKIGLNPEEMAHQAIDLVLSASTDEDLIRLLGAKASARKGRELADRLTAAIGAPELKPEMVIAQYQLQSGKITSRALPSYDHFLNLGSWRNRASAQQAIFDPRSTAHLTAYASKPSPLKAIVDDLRERDGRVVWADAGGGFALAQRQWSQWNLGSDVRRILVDHLNWDLLPHRTLSLIRKSFGADAIDPRHRPEIILSDVSTVRFAPEDRPNLITSFASIQYWTDKLAGIANLYNQMSDGGLLAIANDCGWSSLIHEQGSRAGDSSLVLDRLINGLTQAGLEAAYVTSADSQTLYGLWLRKTPGTMLVEKSRLKHTTTTETGYIVSEYRSPKGRRPPLAVRRLNPEKK